MEKTYSLLPASIDAASEAIIQYCEEHRVDHTVMVKYRFSIEELLLQWLERGEGQAFTLSLRQSLHRPCITISIRGEAYNPLETEKGGQSVLLKGLLSSMNGGYPTYSYINGKNCYIFSPPPKKMNPLLKILIAIAGGLSLGLLIKLLVPASLVSPLLEEYINPFYSASFRLLSFISGPLILLSVAWGIYGIGDASSLGKIGKKMILRFITIIFLIAIAGTCTLPLFHMTYDSGGASSSAVATIFEMLMGIIPANILSPLIDGNTLQIIFTAVLLGLAMVLLGKRVQVVADLVEQINCIVDLIMGFISQLIPGIVFLIMLRILLNGSLGVLGSTWKLMVCFAIEALVLCAVFTLVTALKQRVSPFCLVRKSIPTFLIAITTASSAAAFGSNMETCEKKFGIDKSLSAFGIPLGMVMFKTSTTAYYLLISFFFAKQFGISCSTGWLCSAVFMAAMLAIATPPIPGGGVVAYTVLFTRLGIPEDALAVVLSIDILFDFLRTAANMYNLPLVLINCAANLNLLDKAVLRRKQENIHEQI